MNRYKELKGEGPTNEAAVKEMEERKVSAGKSQSYRRARRGMELRSHRMTRDVGERAEGAKRGNDIKEGMRAVRKRKEGC